MDLGELGTSNLDLLQHRFQFNPAQLDGGTGLDFMGGSIVVPTHVCAIVKVLAYVNCYLKLDRASSYQPFLDHIDSQQHCSLFRRSPAARLFVSARYLLVFRYM
jgi:hypothetical protein